MRNWIKLGALAVVVALAGVGRADDKPKPGDKPTSDDKAMTDSHFVDHAYTDCQNEMLLGRLAQQRAQNEDVRKFAARMIEEHAKGNQAFILIVSELRIAVPDRPLKEQQKDLDRLHGNEVKDFDREYMDYVVKEHEAAVKLFEHASKELKNEKLKEFAAKAVPSLKEHLTLAKEVRDEGVPMLLCEDTEAAAVHARESGWIRPEQVRNVNAEKIKDEVAPSPTEVALKPEG